MADIKFCIHCGNQINYSDKFCPYCGHQQANIPDKESHKASSETFAQSKPASSAKKLVNVDSKRFGNALDLNNLNHYRNRLGFMGNDNLCVYGYFFSTAALMALGMLTVFTNKYYIISFEKDGVLVLGVGVTSHFSGQNSFINFSDISSIKLTSVGLNYHLTIDSPKGAIKAKISKVLLGRPWQARNAKKLAKKYQ